MSEDEGFLTPLKSGFEPDHPAVEGLMQARSFAQGARPEAKAARVHLIDGAIHDRVTDEWDYSKTKYLSPISLDPQGVAYFNVTAEMAEEIKAATAEIAKVFNRMAAKLQVAMNQTSDALKSLFQQVDFSCFSIEPEPEPVELDLAALVDTDDRPFASSLLSSLDQEVVKEGIKSWLPKADLTRWQDPKLPPLRRRAGRGRL